MFGQAAACSRLISVATVGGTDIGGEVAVDVVRMRAALLLRRNWRATLFLALLAGLSGGVAMAAWSLGRQSSTAFERFLAYSEPADLLVNLCPPELAEVTDETLIQCFTYDAIEETQVASALPEVAAAGRAAYIGLTAATPSDPDRTWPANMVTTFDAELTAIDGTPILLAGRRPDPAAPDEIAVNERFAEVAGVTIGDELDLTFWAPEEMGSTAVEGEQFNGPRLRAHIVGIERNIRDLAARVGTAIAGIEEHRMSAGPALAALLAEAGRFGGIAVIAAGDAATAQAAIDEAFAGRLYNVSPNLDADDIEPISEAIDYEAAGMMLFGTITAVAAAVFAGQAVSRQSRKEWADGPALRGLGMSNRDATASALLRGAATGAGAAVIAVGSTVALAALGPFGTGGRVEIATGALLDGPVLLLGAALIVIAVIVATWWPVARQFRRSTQRRSVTARGGLGALQGHLPPTAAAGLSMSLSGRGAGGVPTGTALAGVALALGTVLASLVLTASLETLTSTPAEFGVTWDLSASTRIGGQRDEAVAELLRNEPAVEAAAGISGSDARIGDEVAWVHAFVPVEGVDDVVAPVISEGRPPAAIDEIALGSATMAAQGLSIGDTVEIEPTSSRSGDTSQVTVVGTTIVNDSFENNPGRGGLVTVEWIEEYADELSPDPFLVRLAPGADADAFRTKLEAVATAGVNGPVLQGAIRNVVRIRWVPFLLAATVGALAVASLTHALVLSIRRQRRQLAIFKSLGFRPRQVQEAVDWHAGLLVVAAAAVGVPLGIVLGRWGWRLVADELGVVSTPVTPLWWLAVVVLGVIVLAIVVAAYPGWRAAHEPTWRALRVE